MKLIIAGGRTIEDWQPVYDGLTKVSQEDSRSIKQIVSGGAQGVDKTAEDLCVLHSMAIKIFPADWKTHGKAAGPIRNRLMAEYADALLLVWDGKSKGSASMKAEMEKLKKPVYEIIIDSKIIVD